MEEARVRTRTAAYAICRDPDGRVLMCRSKKYGWWTLPGGALEWGETPAQAAEREVREETGLAVTIHSIVGAYSGVRQDSGVHAVSIVYKARIAGGELRSEPDGSSDRCAWLSATEIATSPLDFFVLAALVAAERANERAADHVADDATAHATAQATARPKTPQARRTKPTRRTGP